MDPLADYTDPFAPPPMIPMGPGTLPQPPAAPAPAPPSSPASTGGFDPDIAQWKKTADAETDAYDKSPQHIKLIADETSGLDKQRQGIERTQSDQDAMNADPNAKPVAPQHFKEAEPEVRDFTVKGMPFILLATALGGKVAKVSGMGMLNAMTGMMEGAQQGSAEAYKAAHDKWTEHYKQFEQEQKDAQTLCESTRQWYKDKTQGDRAAAEMWGQYVGAVRNADNSLANEYNAMQKSRNQLAAMNLQATRIAQKAAAASEKEGIMAANKATAIAANKPRMDTAVKDLADAMSVLEQSISDAGGESKVRYPGAWNSFITSAAGTQAQQQFVQSLKDIKPMLSSLEVGPGAGRTTDLLRQQISETLPTDLFSKSPTEIRTALTQASRLLKQAQELQLKFYDAYAPKARAAGYGVPELSIDTYNPGQPSGPKRIKVDAEGNVVSGN